jgi:catechol 2,3-dioxygenase-like lactoylglutathione lyase family enzyme
MIEGLSHITLIVKDIDRTSEIITRVLGGKQIYDSGDKTFSISKERFFDVNGLWLVLMEGQQLPTQTYNHIAFKISNDNYAFCENEVRKLKLEIKPSRPHLPEEGRSLYFYDYDNHLFELHTGTLNERLQLYGQ